jgi:hypothetical protein
MQKAGRVRRIIREGGMLEVVLLIGCWYPCDIFILMFAFFELIDLVFRRLVVVSRGRGLGIVVIYCPINIASE